MKIVIMRPILHFTIFLFLVLNFLAAQSSEVAGFKAMIEQIKQTSPEPFRDNPGSYMDSPRWLDESACAELQKALQTNWAGVLSSFRDIAPDDTSQVILLLGAQGLPAENYLQFMSGAIDLTKEGALSHRVFIDWGLRPQRPPLRHYLMNSYQDPKVRELIGKAKVFFADDPKMVFYFDNMLSGKMKKDYDAFIAEKPFEVVVSELKPQNASPGRRVWPPKPADKREPSSVAQGDSQAPQAPAVATVTRDGDSAKGMAWLAALALAVIGGALFLLKRSRRGWE